MLYLPLNISQLRFEHIAYPLKGLQFALQALDRRRPLNNGIRFRQGVSNWRRHTADSFGTTMIPEQGKVKSPKFCKFVLHL